MDVRIIECTSPDELYRHYNGEFDAQGAYIELDLCDGTLLADYDAEVGNAAPGTVYHGFQRRYGIPTLTGDAANRVMRELAPLAARMLADWEEEWDGNNMVAVLGKDAQAAEEEIEEQLGLNLSTGSIGAGTQGFDDSDLVAEWDVDGATNGGEAAEYGITADTTDARLDAIEQEILTGLAQAGASSVAVCHGLDTYLKGLRDDLADEDPLTAAEVRVAREYLGLTGDQMAKILGVNPRTLRSWEQGRDDVPGRIRPEIAELKAQADQVVADLVAACNDSDDKVLLTYRTDEDFDAGRKAGQHTFYNRSASWHRQLVARAAAQTGARIDYVDMGETG